MKRLLQLLTSLAVLSVVFVSSSPVLAQDGLFHGNLPDSSNSGNSPEPYSGSPLCQPDPFPDLSSGCLPLGPAQFLAGQASQGLILPVQPLPASSPDPSLNQMTERYLSVNTGGAIPLYASLDAAKARTPQSSLFASKGLKYLAITQRVDDGSGIFFELTSGDWINAADEPVACCISSGRFQGLVFHRNPPNAFGWVLSPTHVKTSPGYNSPDAGPVLNRETIVQIFGMQAMDGTNWLHIGVDQWVDDQYVGRVTPNPVPPAGVNNGRWIEVNEGEQTLSVYENGQLQFATLIATGAKPFYTRPGLFHIYKKLPLETMQGSFEANKSDFYYLEDVPWTMYFDEARALHGAYWRTLYGYMASHGCVNLSPGDAHWLFNWAKEGDWVYVWDPTGQTPTDPKFYGAGGA